MTKKSKPCIKTGGECSKTKNQLIRTGDSTLETGGEYTTPCILPQFSKLKEATRTHSQSKIAEEFDTDLPQRLRTIRNLFKITQSKLCDKIGVSRNTIVNYESGVTIPNEEILNEYAKIFNLPLTYFQDGILTQEELLLFYFSQLSDDNKDNYIKVIENHKNVKLLEDYKICAKK